MKTKRPFSNMGTTKFEKFRNMNIIFAWKIQVYIILHVLNYSLNLFKCCVSLLFTTIKVQYHGITVFFSIYYLSPFFEICLLFCKVWQAFLKSLYTYIHTHTVQSRRVVSNYRSLFTCNAYSFVRGIFWSYWRTFI